MKNVLIPINSIHIFTNSRLFARKWEFNECESNEKKRRQEVYHWREFVLHVSLHSPRPKFLSILLSVDRLGKNVAQEEYIGWIEWKLLFTLRNTGRKQLVFVGHRSYPRWRWHHEFTPTVERAIKRVAVSFKRYATREECRALHRTCQCPRLETTDSPGSTLGSIGLTSWRR